MADSTLKRPPLLVEWGKTITKKIFASNTSVECNIRKHLIDVINLIRYKENYALYLPEKDIAPVLCLLPYLVGFTRAINYVQSIQVNLYKPILVVTNTQQSMSNMLTAIRGKYDSENPFYFISKGILTNEDIENGALYRIFVIASREDLVSYIRSNQLYDMIICSFHWATSIPRHTVSLVIGQDKSQHIEVFKNRVLDSTILLRGIPQDNNSESSTEDVNLQKPLPSSLTKSPSLFWERISESIIQEMATTLNRLSDATCRHIPIELNIKFENQTREIMSILPYLTGEATRRNLSSFDLSKPILFLSMDVFAYETVTSTLPKRSFQRDGSAKFDGYKWSILFNSFDVCTFNRDISDVDVVLTSLEYYNEDNLVVQNDFYKDLDKHQFSAVVIVEGKSYSTEDEAQLLEKFGGLTTIFVRTNANASSSQVIIKTKLSTVFTYGAEYITPELMRHGVDISNRYLISNNSELSKIQQKGLCAITDWFGQTESWKEPAYVTMSIGRRYAGMMVWCLPAMLEWAEKNSLISRRIYNNKKPLLILCHDEFILGHFRDLLYSNKAFYQSSIFTNVYKCGGNVDRCYFVLDENSAAKLNRGAGKYQSIATSMECLDYLGADLFAEVIVFTDNFLSAEDENVIVKKFKGLSKILFFVAKKANSLQSMVFEKQSDAHVCHQIAGVQRDSADCWSHSSYELHDNSQITEDRIRLPSRMFIQDFSESDTCEVTQVSRIRAPRKLPSISSLGSSSLSGLSMEEKISKSSPLQENYTGVLLKDSACRPCKQDSDIISTPNQNKQQHYINKPLKERTSRLNSDKNNRKHLPPLEDAFHRNDGAKDTIKDEFKAKLPSATCQSQSSVTASSIYSDSADFSFMEKGNIVKPGVKVNLRHKKLPPLPSTSSCSRDSSIKLLRKRNKVKPLQASFPRASEDMFAEKRQTWAYGTNLDAAKEEPAECFASASHNEALWRKKQHMIGPSDRRPGGTHNVAINTTTTNEVRGGISADSVIPEVTSDISSVDTICLGDARQSASTIALVGDLVSQQNAVQPKACDMLHGISDECDDGKSTERNATDTRNMYVVNGKQNTTVNKDSQESMAINPFVYSPTASSIAGSARASTEDSNTTSSTKRNSGISKFHAKCKSLLKSIKKSGICPPRRRAHSISPEREFFLVLVW